MSNSGSETKTDKPKTGGGKQTRAGNGGQGRAGRRKEMGVMGLVIALVAMLVGGVLFVGAASGWFDDERVIISQEYYDSERAGIIDLSVEEYNRAVEASKSFVVFVDQDGCKTADRLRGYVENWAREEGLIVQRMMFGEMKELPLHENVKYYPSVVVISHGKPVAWLRADTDEDADAYNDETIFREWVGRYVE